MKNLLVLISGKQGAGKSTLAKNLSEAIEFMTQYKVIVKIMKYADPLYAIHHAVMTTMKEYLPENHQMFTGIDGSLLQIIGTDWVRKKYGQDIWVEIAKRRLESISDIESVVTIIDDARFPNELDIDWPDKLTVRLCADRNDRKARAEKWRDNETHLSETALDEYEVEGKFDIYADTSIFDAGETCNIVKWAILSRIGYVAPCPDAPF